MSTKRPSRRGGVISNPKKNWTPSSPIIQRTLASPPGVRREPFHVPVTKFQVAAAVGVILALSSLSMINLGEGTMKASIAYNVHSPIIIDNNVDLGTKAFLEGWPGDGSPSNPFIIRDLEIDATGVWDAIYIGNVSARFDITNCHLLNAYNAGISLYNTSYGLLEDNICEWNTYGVYSLESDNDTVVNNTCSNNAQYGIYVTYSSWMSMVNNTCDYNTASGVFVESSFMIRADQSKCTGNSDGVTIFSSVYLSVNESVCSSNINTGIYLYDTSFAGVANNTCNQNPEGILAELCSEMGFDNNTCTDNDYDGMYITDSYDLSVNSGVMASNTNGFFIENSDNIGLRNVNASSNWYAGIYVDSCLGVSVMSSECNFNSVGLEIYSTDVNIIEDNASGNSAYGLYAEDVSGYVLGNTFVSGDVGVEIDYSIGVEIGGNLISSCGEGMYLLGDDSIDIFNNVVSENVGNGAYIESTNCQVTDNYFTDNGGYGIAMGSTSGGCLINNNTFMFNYGTTGDFDPLLRQALDDGSGNMWYVEDNPHGWGNYWEDWASQGDTNGDGIVDTAYTLDGLAGSTDEYPLAETTTPIPEFGLLLPVLASMMGILLIAGARRRGK